MKTYSLTMIPKPSYLHVIVTGQNSKDNVMRYLDDVLLECVHRNCRRVLIEERLEGPRLGTLDVYTIASEGSQRALGKISAIAYVDVNAQGDLMKFAETVAVNRMLPVALFSTVSEAEKWLLNDTVSSPSASPPA
jgi:hypothetical protein